MVHDVRELVQQRVYGVSRGYEDCNDSARLGTDPVHRLLLDHDPIDGEPLTLQPTLSRFENGIDERSLVGMGDAIAERVIERYRKRLRGRVRRITIDLDPTDDPTYGLKQLTLFNGHYGNWCYLPVAVFCSLTKSRINTCLRMDCARVGRRRGRGRWRYCVE